MERVPTGQNAFKREAPIVAYPAPRTSALNRNHLHNQIVLRRARRSFPVHKPLNLTKVACLYMQRHIRIQDNLHSAYGNPGFRRI